MDDVGAERTRLDVDRPRDEERDFFAVREPADFAGEEAWVEEVESDETAACAAANRAMGTRYGEQLT